MSRTSLFALLVLAAACTSSPTTPQPTPTPTPTPTTTPAPTATPTPTPDPSPTPTPTPVPVATVLGTVTSKVTGLPIDEADVDLVITAEHRFKSTTDSLGKFTLTGVPIGVRAELRLNASGHTGTTQMVDIDGNMAVTVVMDPIVVAPPPPPPPSGFTTALRVLDAFTRGGIGNAVLTASGLVSAATSGDGSTIVSSETSDSSPRRVSISRPGYVTRETFLRVPGNAADIDLIPSSFDMGSFDALARKSGHINRWTHPLSLWVSQRVMTVIDDPGIGHPINMSVSPDDIAAITRDMREALPSLTGGTITSFSGEAQGSQGSGPLGVTGRVSVYRIYDLGLENGWWGATSVELNGTEIVGAVILLDERLDRTASASDQTRVRAHELGHALGFNHVSRQSLMSIFSGSQLTEWDRLAMRLAYSRAPGNRSPDNDPHQSASPNAKRTRWTPFVGMPIRHR